MVTDWGGVMYFIYLPDHPKRDSVARRQLYRSVLTAARKRGMPIIDAKALFDAHEDATLLFACPDCHYNIEGYRLVAEAVLARLADDRAE